MLYPYFSPILFKAWKEDMDCSLLVDFVVVIEIHQPRYLELMGDMGNLLIRATSDLWGYLHTKGGFKMLSQYAAREITTRMVVELRTNWPWSHNHSTLMF